jgi:hypothetical protein
MDAEDSNNIIGDKSCAGRAMYRFIVDLKTGKQLVYIFCAKGRAYMLHRECQQRYGKDAVSKMGKCISQYVNITIPSDSKVGR